MSEKKSWDIQPKRRTVQIPAPQPREVREIPTRPQAPRVPKRREESAPVAPTHSVVRRVPREKVPQGKDREPLKNRRKRERRRTFWIVTASLLILIVAVISSFWLPFARIQHVVTAGPDSDGMQSIVQNSLRGTYEYVFPRNSIFFFSEETIRQQILKQYPEIAAVSVSRNSFNSITVSSIPRQSAFSWCGEVYQKNPSVALVSLSTTTSATQTGSTLATCYNADAQGVIFAALDSGLQAQGENLTLYAALANNASSPLGSVIADANMIPNALQFIKAMKSLGVPVTTLALRADEADLYTQAGTRITYVLGQEHDAAQLAQSAFPSLNLTDGSLEYIDLRFQGKVYFKKVGVDAQASSTPLHSQ